MMDVSLLYYGYILVGTDGLFLLKRRNIINVNLMYYQWILIPAVFIPCRMSCENTARGRPCSPCKPLPSNARYGRSAAKDLASVF